MVGAVNQGHTSPGILEIPAKCEAAESRAEDDHVRRFALSHVSNVVQSRKNAIDGSDFGFLAENAFALQYDVAVSHSGEVITDGAGQTAVLDPFPRAFAQGFRVGQ